MQEDDNFIAEILSKQIKDVNEILPLKETPEELKKIFDSCESWSRMELLIVLNIINHPNLTQELFDKNYGMAMQKWGPVFDLFEIADWERSKNN